jgi:MoaA/NifB/PqqE/SkfB family radical SAM enzyme
MDLWPDYDDVRKAIDELIELKRCGARILNPPKQLESIREYYRNPEKNLGYRCMMGLENFSVSFNGDARLCYFMGSIGNVVSLPPGKIWLSDSASNQRRIIRTCDMKCCLLKCDHGTNTVDNVCKFMRLARRT